MPSCIVKNCHSNWRKKDKVTIHCFPSDLERTKLWLQQMKQYDDILDVMATRVLAGKPNERYRICSRHFTPDSYAVVGSKTLLKKDALPTIFLEDTTLPTPPRKRKKLQLVHAENIAEDHIVGHRPPDLQHSVSVSSSQSSSSVIQPSISMETSSDDIPLPESQSSSVTPTSQPTTLPRVRKPWFRFTHSRSTMTDPYFWCTNKRVGTTALQGMHMKRIQTTVPTEEKAVQCSLMPTTVLVQHNLAFLAMHRRATQTTVTTEEKAIQCSLIPTTGGSLFRSPSFWSGFTSSGTSLGNIMPGIKKMT